mgnify:CR=1 FL=1
MVRIISLLEHHCCRYGYVITPQRNRYTTKCTIGLQGDRNVRLTELCVGPKFKVVCSQSICEEVATVSPLWKLTLFDLPGCPLTVLT